MGRRWTWAWMLVGAVGCSAEIEGPQEADDGEIELRSLDVSVKNEVCANTRQVARLRENAEFCPSIGGWTRKTLFRNGTAYLATLSPPVAALSKFCTYERQTPPSQDQLEDVTEHTSFLEVAPDCAAMLPTGTLADAVTPALRDLIRNRLGYVTDTDLDLTSSEGGRAPVRVEVVDTIPTVIPTEPNDEHGLAVADLARDIACPGSSTTCSVVVENVLGLPLVKDAMGVRREFEDGGYYGMQSFYAAAIFEAVKRWENTMVMDGPAKLVLNLSVGWPPEWFGGGETEASPGVDAVETALRYARCRGALIIVAAGNDTKDCQSGPTAPALWETRPSPTADECFTDFQISGAPVPASQRPLVFAVGGTELNGRALEVGRPDGRPRLAAIGSHVPGLEQDHVARTGTSMSAAVASGVAALVWSFNSDMTADAIADVLWSSGRDLEETADFGFEGDDTAIRRVSACHALDEACDITGQCQGTGIRPLTCLDDPWLETDEINEAGEGVTPGAPPNSGSAVLGDCPAYCGETVPTWRATGPEGEGATVCATLEFPYRTEHLTGPQPETPACPTCTLSQDGNTAYAETNPRNDGLAIERVVVTVYDNTLRLGSASHDFGAITLSSAMPIPLPLPFDVPSGTDSATITITYVGSNPITDKLAIVR